jgi:hypothetical protein
MALGFASGIEAGHKVAKPGGVDERDLGQINGRTDLPMSLHPSDKP